ncbi:uncharacterized protein B0P05DRAFT_339480 [Gilbertella persicaria]|uniref:uncharacterized protein n=1 Tax=Gilbertella persicaria TaxID=101096 RepID=UPI00221EA366|nr:uncharacterized protein B0P05DRAFT_339480 [Gilbertella persicaria]KAI8048596.1 hypothetical protein B0P05DRAFT_339480 [Gilbertella persicaria]
MPLSSYKLETTLSAHSQDVKAVAAVSNDIVVSASRDKTVRSWTRTSANTFSPQNVYLGHDHFVNALTILQPNPSFPNGNYILCILSNGLISSYRSHCIQWLRQIYQCL